MKRGKITVVAILALLCLLFPCCADLWGQSKSGSDKKAVTDKNKASIGAWAENNVLKIKVTKVEEITKWEDLKLTKRITSVPETSYKKLKAEMDEGKSKIVLVTATVKNVSAKDVNIGWNGRGYLSFSLRGDEGSVQQSDNINTVIGEHAIVDSVSQVRNILQCIQGMLPKDATVTPGGQVEGKAAFAVPSWYTPAVFYVDKKCKNWWGSMEIIIKLR
ncbi:MAG: hypothetical protein AB2L14_10440 [Candidatus Xenobiia bacterium LiM19]